MGSCAPQELKIALEEEEEKEEERLLGERQLQSVFSPCWRLACFLTGKRSANTRKLVATKEGRPCLRQKKIINPSTPATTKQSQAELEGGEDRQLGIFLMISDQRKIQRKIIKICETLD